VLSVSKELQLQFGKTPPSQLNQALRGEMKEGARKNRHFSLCELDQPPDCHLPCHMPWDWWWSQIPNAHFRRAI